MVTLLAPGRGTTVRPAAWGGLHEVGAGVGDGGGAGIADVGDALAGLHELDQGLGAADFVVLVQGHEALVHAQVAQEAAGDAGVFTGDDVGQGEGLDGAQVMSARLPMGVAIR